MSLEECIAVRRKVLVDARNEAPSLLRKAETLRQQASALSCRYQKRAAADLLQEASEIAEEGIVRDSMVREHVFENTVVSYLKLYHQCTTTHFKNVRVASKKRDTIEAYARHCDVSKAHKMMVIDEYLTEIDNAAAKVALSVRDECPFCDMSKLLLCTLKSIMVCPKCGYSIAYIDATTASISFDDIVEFSQYSYKRVNHYIMWLALVQGKETHRVPDDVLETVMEYLYMYYKVRNSADITQKMVRESLRKLKLKRAYDHVAQITSRLAGVLPPRIGPQVEEKLKTMFLQMQPVFQRHAPKTRTNFLSYSYVLYRSFQILGLHHMLEGMSLLKGRDKLEANDSIFKHMCIDLGWPVFELPP